MSTRSEPAIIVDGIRKTFTMEAAGKKEVRTKVAVDDVSFTVARGESVAIVGRNGAGKSTLLRIICGIVDPDTGQVIINGEVSQVFGMQAGFSPDLSGIENIQHKCALQGLDDATIAKKLNEIATFADIGDHIHEPLRTYSNGMRGRLAFAVTFATNPDILIVDETLAAGDMAFHTKCMERIGEIRNSGATVLIVSHGLALVNRFCDRAILLEGGRLVLQDTPDKVQKAYTDLVQGRVQQPVSAPPPVQVVTEEVREPVVRITRLKYAAVESEETPGTAQLTFNALVKQPIENAQVEVTLAAIPGGVQLMRGEATLGQGDGGRYRVAITMLDLLQAGRYRVDILIRDADTTLYQGSHRLKVGTDANTKDSGSVNLGLSVDAQQIVRP